MNWKDLKIRVCGTKGKVAKVEKMLEELELTGKESKDRLILQEFIDKNRIKEDIIYDGNTIISYNRIIKEYKNIFKKGKFTKMTDYFYSFLHLNCGSIAHYNKQGWLAEYNSLDKLKRFFNKNEYGKNIVDTQPNWKTDVIKIGKEILKLTKEQEKKNIVKQNLQQLDMFNLTELIVS